MITQASLPRRYDRWKISFSVQDHHGFEVWSREWETIRVPLIEDLRADLFERAEYDAEDYRHWLFDHAFLLVPARAYVKNFLMTFKDYPQRQKVGSFLLTV